MCWKEEVLAGSESLRFPRRMHATQTHLKDGFRHHRVAANLVVVSLKLGSVLCGARTPQMPPLSCDIKKFVLRAGRAEQTSFVTERHHRNLNVKH